MTFLSHGVSLLKDARQALGAQCCTLAQGVRAVVRLHILNYATHLSVCIHACNDTRFMVSWCTSVKPCLYIWTPTPNLRSACTMVYQRTQPMQSGDGPGASAASISVPDCLAAGTLLRPVWTRSAAPECSPRRCRGIRNGRRRACTMEAAVSILRPSGTPSASWRRVLHAKPQG